MNQHVQPEISGASTEPCLIGKLVSINGGRGIGRVTGKSTFNIIGGHESTGRDQYMVKIFNELPNGKNLEMLCWPRDLEVMPSPQAAASRLFMSGEHARTSDGVVYIIEDMENGYNVALVGGSEERFYRAEELSPWLPLAGERVREVDNEESVAGIVMHVGELTSLVKWPGFVRPQTWANADLEPA
jgi:hypothetical protein